MTPMVSMPCGKRWSHLVVASTAYPQREEEAFFILEGEITFTVNGEKVVALPVCSPICQSDTTLVQKRIG